MINQETGAVTVQVPLCRRQVTADISGDFSLPDYQPEIRRLLRVSASVLPPTRYAGNGCVDLGGTVNYFVTYLAPDGGLYCAPLSAEYRMTVPFEGKAYPADPPVVICCPAAESVNGRVTAPRRLSVRCRIGADVTVMGEADLTAGDDMGLVPGSVERLEGSMTVCRISQCTGDTLSLQDDMITGPGEDLRVICAEGQVMVSEAQAGAGIVTCRGEVTLKLTVTPMEHIAAPDEAGASGESVTPPAPPRVMLRKLPFSQTLTVPGVTPDCRCCARGICEQMSVEAEDGRLHTELGVILEVLAQGREMVSYTRDAYATRAESSCTYETHTPTAALDCLNGNFTLSDSLPLSEAGIEPGAAAVDATCALMPETLTAVRDRWLMSGTCRARLLTVKGGEYAANEVTFPFRCELDAPGLREHGLPEADAPLSFHARADAVTCRVRMDGERVGIDAEVAVALSVARPQTLTVRSGMTLGADLKCARGEYLICFPAPGDTLWSVAKRCRTPLAALSACNELPAAAPDSPASLEGVGYLIV